MPNNLDLLAGIIGAKLLGGGAIDSLCLPSSAFECDPTVECKDFFACDGYRIAYICRAEQFFVCPVDIFTCENDVYFRCYTYFDCPEFTCNPGTNYQDC